MKLDIIVPHYKEPWETCKYLFDTIATQRGVLFDNIRVIVVNDGDDVLLDEYLYSGYPFTVDYIIKPHGGVSAARNAGLEASDADYVMFCDIDDGFLNNYGLHLIFSAMQEGADYIFSNFVEEYYPENNTMSITRHEDDFTFMHGKVYRRQFLVENNLRFDPDMTLHEDGYFNSVAVAVAKKTGKIKKIETPIYLWRWNDNSTVRSNSLDFVLRTYEHVIKARTGVCEQLKARGYEKELRDSVCLTVMNSYYDMQKPSYRVDRNREHFIKAERAFKTFWKKYGSIFRDCTNLEISEIACAARKNAVEHGMLLELQDLRSWLKHIGNEVR